MAGWSGTVYASGTITENGNSGFLDLESVSGLSLMMPSSNPVVIGAWIRLIPANLATDETLDLDLNVAFDSAGTGDIKIHDFTQVTSTNAAENLVIPGGESENLLQVDAATNAYNFAPFPVYWKFTWTLGGSSKSMDFTVYGCLEFSS